MQNIDVIVKDSGRPGPRLVVIGGVHGNEHCGEQAIKELAPTFAPKKGKVTFIIANKAALLKNVRFVESNLNRSFNTAETSTLEERTAAAIKPYLDEADSMLDLHASNSEETFPFCICEEHSLSVAKALPAKLVLTGIDNFHGGSTDHYMNQQGKVGICIECGCLEDTVTTTKVAKQAIMAFCKRYGVIDGAATEQQQDILKATRQYKSKRGPFTPTKEFKDFELVKRGGLIGHDGNRAIVAEEDLYVLFVRKRANPGEECFMTAKKM